MKTTKTTVEQVEAILESVRASLYLRPTGSGYAAVIVYGSDEFTFSAPSMSKAIIGAAVEAGLVSK